MTPSDRLPAAAVELCCAAIAGVVRSRLESVAPTVRLDPDTRLVKLYDNGWNFFDQDWNPTGACCWDVVRYPVSDGRYAHFAGDPNNSNEMKGRACQLIDVKGLDASAREVQGRVQGGSRSFLPGALVPSVNPPRLRRLRRAFHLDRLST